MNDPELDRLRQQRLAQLQNQHGVRIIHDYQPRNRLGMHLSVRKQYSRNFND